MVRALKSVTVLLLIVAMLSVSGVMAAWQYSHKAGADVKDVFTHGIKVFSYKPEDIVPDDEEASKVGENHLALIEKILWEASYGLNATKKPILHNLLKKEGDVVYCSQNVQGGNLKHLMVDGTAGAEQLYFVLERVTATEYNCYTFRYADMIGYAIGTEIEVYRTVMRKGTDNIWLAPLSYFGHAKINDPDIVSRGIDVTTWHDAH